MYSVLHQLLNGICYLQVQCEKNLAKYSLPAVYEFRDSLPKTLVGKVAYRKLMEEENK